MLSCIDIGSFPVRRQLLGWRKREAARLLCQRSLFRFSFWARSFCRLLCLEKRRIRFIQHLTAMKNYRMTCDMVLKCTRTAYNAFSWEMVRKREEKQTDRVKRRTIGLVFVRRFDDYFSHMVENFLRNQFLCANDGDENTYECKLDDRDIQQ